MLEIHSEFEDMHDENAMLTGFIEFKALRLYEKGEEIPGDKNVQPIGPCLVMEVIDEEESTADVKLMKPINWISLNKKQILFFKNYLALRNFEDERKKMV